MLTLEKNKLESSIGVLRSQTNTEVIEKFSQLANTLKDAGDNEQVSAFLESCRKFQAQFNEFTDETVEKFIKDMSEVYDIAEWLEKNTVDNIKNRDLASEKAGKIDGSQVMQ